MFNFYIANKAFSNGLKKADINPVLKETNYRPISILPIISKTFESCLYDQIYEYTDNMLSNAQCSFSNNYD